MARTKYERKLRIKRAREGEKTAVEATAAEERTLQREEDGNAAVVVVVVAAVVAAVVAVDGREQGNPASSIGAEKGGGDSTELEEGEVPSETQADMAIDLEASAALEVAVEVSSAAASSPRSASSAQVSATTRSDGNATAQANQLAAEGDSIAAEASNGKHDPDHHHECRKAPSLSPSRKTTNCETSTTLPQDELHAMLQRLEAEIAARIHHRAPADHNEATAAPPASLCSHHDQQIRQLECDLELALRRADTLAVQNAEWKHASHKQLDYQSALRELHIAQRTHAEQLRRVARSLQSGSSGCCRDALTALYGIAETMHPSSDSDTKAVYPETPNAIVFPPQCTRICNKSGGSRDWYAVKQEGEEMSDFSDEYAIRVFRLTAEPLKTRPHDFTRAKSSCVETAPPAPTKNVEIDLSQSHAYVELLKQSKRLMTEPYLYAPPRSKRQRTRPGDSSSDDDDDDDTTPAHVVVQSCSSSVLRGSDDAFLLISL